MMAYLPPGKVEIIPTPGPVTLVSGPTLENSAIKFALSLPKGEATSPNSVTPAGNVPSRPKADTANANESEAGKLTGWRPSFPDATSTSVPFARAPAIG